MNQAQWIANGKVHIHLSTHPLLAKLMRNVTNISRIQPESRLDKVYEIMIPLERSTKHRINSDGQKIQQKFLIPQVTMISALGKQFLVYDSHVGWSTYHDWTDVTPDELKNELKRLAQAVNGGITFEIKVLYLPPWKLPKVHQHLSNYKFRNHGRYHRHHNDH